MLAVPVAGAAGASVDPQGAMHAYARARLADGDGAMGLAVDNYRAALTLDPASVDVARRSYAQALESGDRALALRSAGLLEAEGALPRDGTLLLIGEALGRKDWSGARTLMARMVEEGNFSFLAPIITSWILLGEGHYAAPVVTGQDRFTALAQRYVDEHVALQALAHGDLTAAVPAIRRAIALRGGESAALRLTLAWQLAGRGAKAEAEALMLLPPGEATFARARSDLARGKVKAAPVTPAQGYARLLSRLAVDVASDSSGMGLAIRLARIATFADPGGAEAQLVAAQLLSAGGLAQGAVAEARKVPVDGWYGALGQAELVDALAAADETQAALVLAKKLAAEPGAGSEQQVRLGRLLADMDDFDGAAKAFRAAQSGYGEGEVPWALLLFEGSALEQGKRWDEARVVLERAAALAPNEPMVLNYLGYAQIERRQNIAAALELIRKASLLKPQDASIADSLGWAHYVTGDVAGAVPVLERAAAGAPGDATINEHLGDALWSAGRRYEARYAWAAASLFAQGDGVARIAAKVEQGLKPEYAAP